MCGIVFYKSFVKKNVSKKIIKQFQKQRNRGKAGFGFYIPAIDRLTHNERERRILRLLKRTKSSEILFHHRYPTSTDNVRNACHPFSTKHFFNHNYVLVHNGVIFNDDALKISHEDLGIKYISEQDNGKFNDSEALLYDVALYLEGKQPELKAEGNIAFIVVENDENNMPIKLHFGRNTGNPLMMDYQDDYLSLASEGNGVAISPNKLYTFDYKDQELEIVDLEIPEYKWLYQQSAYQGGGNNSSGAWGFQGSSYSENYYDGKVYDPALKRWVDDPLVANRREEYLTEVYWKGEQLANDLWEEHGTLLKALEDVYNQLDSARGKLQRIKARLSHHKIGSKKYRMCSKERDSLMIREDILLTAIDSLEDYDLYAKETRPESAQVEQAIKKELEAQEDGYPTNNRQATA